MAASRTSAYQIDITRLSTTNRPNGSHHVTLTCYNEGYFASLFHQIPGIVQSQQCSNRSPGNNVFDCKVVLKTDSDLNVIADSISCLCPIGWTGKQCDHQGNVAASVSAADNQTSIDWPLMNHLGSAKHVANPGNGGSTVSEQFPVGIAITLGVLLPLILIGLIVFIVLFVLSRKHPKVIPVHYKRGRTNLDAVHMTGTLKSENGPPIAGSGTEGTLLGSQLTAAIHNSTVTPEPVKIDVSGNPVPAAPSSANGTLTYGYSLYCDPPSSVVTSNVEKTHSEV